MRPRLSFIGAGKVGNTLARLYYAAGYEITAVYSRTQCHAEQLAQVVNAKAAHTAEAAADSDLVFLTVPDDAIASVAAGLLDAEWQNRAVIHTSGALSIDILQILAAQGAMLGGLHPVFPFADVEYAIKNLHGAVFAVESSHPQLHRWLRELIVAVDGQAIEIPTGKKAVYHLALVFVSNYTVTLYATAQQLLDSIGADKAITNAALVTLLQATVLNIRQQGIPDALTGPLVRADQNTIQAHLRSIDDATLRSVYRGLAQLSYPMLAQRGISTHLIEQILQDAL